MPIKESAVRNKIIRDEVHKQVNDVNAIIKGLLAKKIAELKAQNPEGQQKEQEKQADYGQLYNSVVEALDNLKLEVLNNPTSETVRQVKLMLNDIVKNFKGMSTSSIKAILDLLYNFIPYTKAYKQPVSNIHNNDSNYSTEGNKTKELRRLIRDSLLRFVHENAKKYLGADIYPKTYDEAVKYFNIEELGNNIVDKENQDAKDRNNVPRNADIRNKAVSKVIDYFINHPLILGELYSSKSTIPTILKKHNADEIYNEKFKEYYNDELNNFVEKAVDARDGTSSVQDLETLLLANANASEIKRLKKALKQKVPIFKLLQDTSKPNSFNELCDIIKVADDMDLREELYDKL
jgi:hypothetical protein